MNNKYIYILKGNSNIELGFFTTTKKAYKAAVEYVSDKGKNDICCQKKKILINDSKGYYRFRDKVNYAPRLYDIKSKVNYSNFIKFKTIQSINTGHDRVVNLVSFKLNCNYFQ